MEPFWTEGQPPKKSAVKTFLLKAKSGIVCSGKYRYGNLGEPSQNTLDWRCDCCGRFATPIAWATIPENKIVRITK